MNNNLKYNSSYSKSNLKPNSARKSIKLSGAWKSGEIESYTVGENINGVPKMQNNYGAIQQLILFQYCNIHHISIAVTIVGRAVTIW